VGDFCVRLRYRISRSCLRRALDRNSETSGRIAHNLKRKRLRERLTQNRRQELDFTTGALARPDLLRQFDRGVLGKTGHQVDGDFLIRRIHNRELHPVADLIAEL